MFLFAVMESNRDKSSNNADWNGENETITRENNDSEHFFSEGHNVCGNDQLDDTIAETKLSETGSDYTEKIGDNKVKLSVDYADSGLTDCDGSRTKNKAEGSMNLATNTGKNAYNSDSKVHKEYIDIDEFLYRSGECGRYQISLVLQMMLITFPLAFPVFIFYFIGHDPSWICTHASQQKDHKHSQCNANDFRIHGKDDSRRCKLNRTEWDYDFVKSSMVTEFDLVCEDSWLLAMSGSSVFVGWGVGSILMGYLADLYGRKAVMFPTMFLDLLCLFLHFFIKSIWLLIVIRFLMGVFHAGPALNAFILLVEFIGPNCRVLAANVAGLVWAGAAAALSLKAYLIDDWRMLCLACSAPYFVLVLFCFCFPESVRWLNMNGRTAEAEEILHHAAQVNNNVLNNVSIKPVQSENTGQTFSYKDFFKSWPVAKVVLSQGYIWFNCGMVYYTLSWTFADLGGDIYVNFMLSVIVEVPMHGLAIVCLQKFGRKKTTMASLLIASITCICVGVCISAENLEAARLLFGLLGKSAVSLAFMSIYMWSAEIYPTVVRTQGMGFNIVTSRAGAAASPFAKILDHIHPSVPFILMAVTTMIAFLLAFVLPETLGKKTRETFEDLLLTD